MGSGGLCLGCDCWRDLGGFLDGDTPLFGGDRNPANVDVSSGEFLLRDFVGDNEALRKAIKRDLKGVACRCSIRGWSSEHNCDIDFTL